MATRGPEAPLKAAGVVYADLFAALLDRGILLRQLHVDETTQPPTINLGKITPGAALKFAAVLRRQQ